MAHCCRTLRQEYDGAFSHILNTGVFADFLSSELSLNDFLRKESVYGWCGDAFAAASAWPVMPDIHLRAAGYRSANISRRNILTHGSGSYLRFMNAVDTAVLGAWIGFSVKDVGQALSWLLNPESTNGEEDIVLWPRGATDRLIIPLFSCGFQGEVFGFFTGLSPHQKEQVLESLCFTLDKALRTITPSCGEMSAWRYCANAAMRSPLPARSFALCPQSSISSLR